jgi:predicted deacetylase
VNDPVKRKLCIAIHDVSPATWPDCERLLRLLRTLGRLPVTLAVVPDFHGKARVDRAPWFAHAIDACIAEGAEVALHGYRHLDDSRPPSNVRSWVQRRVLTAGEGEFAALSAGEAASRIQQGQNLLKACGWRATGFIPPAWLAGEGTRQALRKSPFVYTSSQFTLSRLADGLVIDAPCVTVSARSSWRRAASKLWLNAIETATAGTPLLRIAMHPVDAEHEDVRKQWRELIARLLARRTALTKHQAVTEHA